MSTNNLDLTTFNMLVDPDQSFENYRLNLDGPTNSNMTIIDAWALTVPLLLSSLLSDTTASLVPARNFITNATGSAIASACVVHSVETFFIKLAEFSGSGQADFSGISQSFNHILILGQTSTSAVAPGFVDVGIDFNGDTTSASYLTMQWSRGGSATPYAESFNYYQSSQITIGTVPCFDIEPRTTGTIMAIIPYYSGSGGFYKTAMGFSSSPFYSIPPPPGVVWWAYGSMQGGFYQSTSAITRIRMFGKQHQSGSSIGKINFYTGTKISLYGFI